LSINFTEHLEVGMDYLHKSGAFLTVKNINEVNTMTISWGSIGYIWNKPIFTVLVRNSRYTHELIEITNEFTVSIPLNNVLKKELLFCGTKSGRDVNKIAECNLNLADSKMISTPIIGNCQLHYECKILYKYTMSDENLNKVIKDTSYSSKDFHTMYYGEIICCYTK